MRTSILLIMLLLSVAVVAELQPSDIQKIVRDENAKLKEDIITHQEQLKTDIREESMSFATQVMTDFIAVIEDAQKKVVIIAVLGISGAILFIEGILGFIRIKKESSLLLLLKRDIDILKRNIPRVTSEPVPSPVGVSAYAHLTTPSGFGAVTEELPPQAPTNILSAREQRRLVREKRKAAKDITKLKAAEEALRKKYPGMFDDGRQ